MSKSTFALIRFSLKNGFRDSILLLLLTESPFFNDAISFVQLSLCTDSHIGFSACSSNSGVISFFALFRFNILATTFLNHLKLLNRFQSIVADFSIQLMANTSFRSGTTSSCSKFPVSLISLFSQSGSFIQSLCISSFMERPLDLILAGLSASAICLH